VGALAAVAAGRFTLAAVRAVGELGIGV